MENKQILSILPFYKMTLKPIVDREAMGTNLGFEIFIVLLTLGIQILNGLVILVTTLRGKRNRAIDGQLIFLIASFDFFVGFFIMISIFIRWSYGDDYLKFLEGPWCAVSSIVNSSSNIIALVLTAQLSIIRYLAIVRSYSIVNYKSTIVSIFIIVVIFLAFLLGTILGQFKLLPSGMFCIPTGRKSNDQDGSGINSSLSFIPSVIILIISVPFMIAIPICYGLISYHYHKLVTNIKTEPNPYNKVGSYKKTTYIFYLLLVGMAYFVTLLPQTILLIYESISHNNRKYTVDCITFTLFLLVSVINPLFVLSLHPESRQELMTLLKSGFKFHQIQNSQDGHLNINYSTSEILVSDTSRSN